jgi:hypothetical protein
MSTLPSVVFRTAPQPLALRDSASQTGARPRRNVTAQDRARLKLRGEYLGLMRHLPKTRHGAHQDAPREARYPAAIKLARRLGG